LQVEKVFQFKPDHSLSLSSFLCLSLLLALLGLHAACVRVGEYVCVCFWVLVTRRRLLIYY